MYITYENGELSTAVWLNNGNLAFLHEKHIAFVAVVLPVGWPSGLDIVNVWKP